MQNKEINTLFLEISKKIDLLNKNQNWDQVLYPWLRTELTYTSNSLEGSTLSLIETKIIVEDNQGVAGKSLREIYEAKNHAKAWNYIQANLVKKDLKNLNESDLLKIQELLLNNIDDFNAGKYRNVAVRIAGSYTIFPNYLKVPDLMSLVFEWLHTVKLDSLVKILETAILTHLKIVKIHPFTDGNGRTTRLIMNTILMQNYLPPINVLPKKRKEYLESLEVSNDENFAPFLKFMLEMYNQNLNIYLETF